MRRVIGVALFLVGIALLIWGVVFRQWPLTVPGVSQDEGVLKISEVNLNALFSREAVTRTPEGGFALTSGVVQRLPGEGLATAAEAEKAAEDSDGVCET